MGELRRDEFGNIVGDIAMVRDMPGERIEALKRVAELEAEVARLRASLYRVAHNNSDWFEDACNEMQTEAREALGEK